MLIIQAGSQHRLDYMESTWERAFWGCARWVPRRDWESLGKYHDFYCNVCDSNSTRNVWLVLCDFCRLGFSNFNSKLLKYNSFKIYIKKDCRLDPKEVARRCQGLSRCYIPWWFQWDFFRFNNDFECNLFGVE